MARPRTGLHPRGRELLRPDYVTHLFRRLVREAGLPEIRFHGLRHTSAGLALAAGVQMTVVSDRLGHSSTTITSDLYAHVVPAVAREAAEKIAALVPRRARAPRKVSFGRPEYCESTAPKDAPGARNDDD